MPTPDADPIRVRDLSVEAHGPTVLVLRGDDGDESERRLFTTIPVAAGDGLVLASSGAIRASGFRAALRHASRMALTAAARDRPSTSDVPRLWLAISGLGCSDGRGRSLAQKLAREFSADVFAPDGPLTFVAGSIFAGADHHGWLRFAAGAPGELHCARHPRPDWEAQLPRGTVHDGGLCVRPAPTGLAVSASEADADDSVSHAVPVSAHHPRLVLGRPGGEPIAAHQVAALLRRFPLPLRERMQLVPADPRCASSHWLGKLAELVGHDVVSTTGMLRQDAQAESVLVTDECGKSLWRPFPAALRYSPKGASAPVLAGAPPQGWCPAWPLRYRWGGTPGSLPRPDEIVAKVVPAGLALVTAAQAAVPGAADRLMFEADRVTVALGWPCAPLPDGTPVALYRLLAGLSPEQFGRLRVLVLGLAGKEMREHLRAAAGNAAHRLHWPPVLSAPPSAPRLALEAGHHSAESSTVPSPVVSPAEVLPAARTRAEDPGDSAAAASEATVRISRAELGEKSGGDEPSPEVPKMAPTARLEKVSSENAASSAGDAGGVRSNDAAPDTRTAAPREELPKRTPGASPLSQQLEKLRAKRRAAAHKAWLGERTSPEVEGGGESRRTSTSASAEPAGEAVPPPSREESPEPVGSTSWSVVESSKSTPDSSARLPAVASSTMKLPTVPAQPPSAQPPSAQPPSAQQPADQGSRAAPALVPASFRCTLGPEHQSTEDERAGFARLVGVEFEVALPAVHNALVGFPALCEEQVEGAKSDFVAVHLYLGAGSFGAVAVNDVLRGAFPAELGDYVACLLSGLRRLPVHRGPVFRLLPRPALDAYEAGTVLSEPAFLSASTAQDVAAPNAQVAEVLIWSQSPRRTSAFHRHGLPDEVVFPAGSRFRVLAVHRPEDSSDSVPPALLLRELRSDETPEPGALDDTDRALLPRLRRALDRRHRTEPRRLTGDALARITAPVGLVPANLTDPARL